MKRIILSILILLLLVIGIVYAYTETTHTQTVGTRYSNYCLVKKFTTHATTDDVNDFSQAFMSIWGYAERIVIDSTGTDTTFQVTLKDENAVAIFDKDDLTSANDPQGFAIYEDANEGTAFRGVPVGGIMTVYVVDANGLTDLSVVVYYREEIIP